MLPNWIYYFLGKKSGGSSPTPPEPPEPPAPTKVVIYNGIKPFEMGSLYNLPVGLTQQEAFDNLINSFDFDDIIRWQSWFSSFTAQQVTICNLSDTKLKNKMTTINSLFSNSYYFKDIYLWGEFDSSSCTNFGAMFSYCSALENIYGVEKIDFSSATNLQFFINQDSNLSNDTLLNIAKALLTVPTNYGNKSLSHLGFNNTQANYVANNSPDWEELQTNGWTTGY